MMCWPHVHRNLESHFKHLRSVNKEIASKLQKDIEELQWAADSKDSFLYLAKVLEEKYRDLDNLDSNTKTSLQSFFQYLQMTWVNSPESNWYEGAHPYGVSNNQGIEGVNQSIKDGHTCRKRLPLGRFCDVMLRMTHEWSLQDHSLLREGRTEALNGQFGLKLRTDGYSWFQLHRQNTNYLGIKTDGKTTLMSEVEAIWAIPSSNTKEAGSLKELAKKRMALRNDASFAPSFDDFLTIRSSCWLVERKGGQYFCDCFNGMKGRLCKHAIGLMYKTGDLMVTEDVRSKPLGQKRRKGRPKNLPKNSCRVHSPPPPPVIPMASYHPASPELRTLSPIRPGSAFSGVRSQLTPSSPVLQSRRPADQSSPELMTSELAPSSPGPSLAAPIPCPPHSPADPSPSYTIPAATRKSARTKVSNPPINRKRKAPPVSPVAVKKIHLTFVEHSNVVIRTIEKKRQLRKRK